MKLNKYFIVSTDEFEKKVAAADLKYTIECVRGDGYTDDQIFISVVVKVLGKEIALPKMDLIAYSKI